MTTAFPNGLTAPQQWLDGLLPKCPNVPQDMVKHELLTVLREFFSKSGAWRDWIGPITLHENEVFYSTEQTDYKAELVDILGAYRLSDEMPLSPAPPQYLGVDVTLLGPGTPNWFYRTVEGLACIFPSIPAGVDERVHLFATMKPLDLCVPDWVRSRFYDDICSGVLARVYAVPGAGYKPDLVARLDRRFRAGIGRATADVLAAGTPLTLTALHNAPPFVRGSQRLHASTIAVSGRRW